MRKTITAILLSLIISTSVSSCASNDVAGHGSDAGGLLVIAAILGAGVAIAAH